MKKKYNLPIGASGSGPKKLSPPAEAKEAKVPMTPNKNRITKTRGRAVPVKKNPNAKYLGYDSDSNDSADIKTTVEGNKSAEKEVIEAQEEIDCGEGDDEEDDDEEESGMDSDIFEVEETTEV